MCTLCARAPLHRARHRRHGRCCAWTAAACIVQHPCRRLLLPADQDLRGDDRPAPAVDAATRHAASWRKPRKVVARVEASEQGSDVRFIVTNLPGPAKVLYEKVYCARGRMENLIKDMKLYTRSDRTSCHRWEANQFRLFLHMGAYWLLHELRGAAPKRSIWRTATFETIRCAFLKIAVRIEELKTRIKMALPSSYPHVQALTALATSIAACGP